MFLLLLTRLRWGGEPGEAIPRLFPHPRPEFQPSSLTWEAREAFVSIWLLTRWPSSPLSLCGEGGGEVSVRALPLLPLCIAPVLDLETAEREDRDIASAPESDVIVPVTRSALAPALLIGSILKSVHAPALAKVFTVESAPMIVGTHVSTALAILQSAPSTVLGLGSVPTAPELLRSEAIDQNAMVRAPHRFWGKRRSDLTSVPCVKCFRA